MARAKRKGGKSKKEKKTGESGNIIQERKNCGRAAAAVSYVK